MSDANYSELIAPSDSLASRTGQTNVAYVEVFNGTTWDQMRSSGVTGMQGVGGDTASGATDAGNPVKIGGHASTTAPAAVTAGQRVNAWMSLNGALAVFHVDSSGNVSAADAAPSDTESNAQNMGNTQNYAMVFGGTTWDRVRSATADAMASTGLQAAAGMLWDANDSDWDRARSASADAQPNDGLAAASLVAYNGGGDATGYDRVRNIVALSAAPNVDTGILAVGIGPGWDRKLNPSNLATAVNSAITQVVNGADTYTFTIGTSTTGTIIFEVTGDDSNWTTAASVIQLGALDLWIGAAVTPVTGTTYMVRTTGWRQVRVRTASTLGATVAVFITGATGPAIIKAIDSAPQPHAIGQSVLNYESASLGVVTSQVAVAATAGKRVYVTNVRISVGGTTAGSIAIYSGTGAFTEGTSPTIAMFEFAPSATIKPGALLPFVIPFASGTVNEDIRITTVGLTATHVSFQYYIA